MSFDVEPQALRTFGRHLAECAVDVADGKTYLLRHGDFTFREQGTLMTILMSSHGALMDELQHRLAHLQDLLEQSDLAMRDSARHYEETDLDSAAQVDATYPSVDRPTTLR